MDQYDAMPCDECKHFLTKNDEDPFRTAPGAKEQLLDVKVCAKDHKPRFFPPRPCNQAWGYMRVCSDFSKA
jgi:hypothetical protein